MRYKITLNYFEGPSKVVENVEKEPFFIGNWLGIAESEALIQWYSPELISSFLVESVEESSDEAIVVPEVLNGCCSC